LLSALQLTRISESIDLNAETHPMQPHMSRKAIPIDLNPKLEIEIAAAPIATALDLPVDMFLQLLKQHKIDQLCERGTGDDAGLYRASFYHAGKRVRVVLDRDGQQQGDIELRTR
jgi:hypothetical protein